MVLPGVHCFEVMMENSLLAPCGCGSSEVLKWRCVEGVVDLRGNRYISIGEGDDRCHRGILQCNCNGVSLAKSHHDYVASN